MSAMRSSIDSNLIVQVVIAGVIGLCSGVVIKGLRGVKQTRNEQVGVLESQIENPRVVSHSVVSEMSAGSRHRRRPVYRRY